MMGFPRLPDWTIYAAVIGALLIVSLGRREKADAPHVPEDDEAHGPLLGPVTPFDPSVTVIAPDVPFQPSSGTAFSIAGDGRWVTARHVVEGCRRPALLVGGERAVAAAFRLAPHADLALLITDGGPTDSWQNAARLVHEGEAAKKFKFFAVGVEGANFDILKQISVSDPIKLKGMRFRDLFAWLSSSLSSVSQSQPGDDVALVNPVTPNGWGSIA